MQPALSDGQCPKGWLVIYYRDGGVLIIPPPIQRGFKRLFRLFKRDNAIHEIPGAKSQVPNIWDLVLEIWDFDEIL